MSEQRNYFAELASIDVSKHVEKKGRFSYLSWSWAVDQLLKKCPDATWQVVRFDGLPYMKTEVGYFVEVEVTVNNITRSQIHPVLDNYNKPIAKPTSFQINTSIQRCLAKAIALHGLGLYIYSGEDIPRDDEPKQPNKQQSTVPEQEQQRQAQVANEQRIQAIHAQIRELSEVYGMLFEETKATVKQSLGIQTFKGITVQQASNVQRTITSWLNDAKANQQKSQQAGG
ncbi:DUF1071 domain-containing protein [Bacillus multifaciens]|uniref:DUF1071 domain-containing protein n=1 Tax=Bacillus multifaciens TaxID=3068506 RepID=UPI0027404A3C|nr:DUF1071 domain-containing protein [Bacillus sp. WLY-B-L8]MDP7981010.1 DUF1071 domain-containing protein [Bacillus sp. WLY-B-L8]